MTTGTLEYTEATALRLLCGTPAASSFPGLSDCAQLEPVVCGRGQHWGPSVAGQIHAIVAKAPASTDVAHLLLQLFQLHQARRGCWAPAPTLQLSTTQGAGLG